MKKYATFLIAIAFQFCAFAQPSILPTNDKIQYTGRIDFSTPTEPTYSFPGISIKAKFNGTGIQATIYDYSLGTEKSTNYYKVFIDGAVYTEQLEMTSGENTYTLATGLSAGEHTIELMKITEGAAGKSSFRGFTVIGGNQELLDLPARPDLKIEFIGDSWTAGFGNLSQYASGQASMENGDYVAANQDNYYAWGPITARAVNAEYHVTAISGRGLYRNNTGSMTGTLPLNYDNIFEDDNSVQYDHSWHPDIISIHLGTNDMAQEEGGQQYKLDDEAFTDTYIQFIDKLITLHDCAEIIICFGNSKSDSWPTWTNQLTRLRNIANDIVARYPDGNVTSLELPFTAEKWTGNPADDCGYGDAWHPSKCSHEEMAVELIDKVNDMNVDPSASNCNYTLTSAEFQNKLAMSVFPNPATDVLNISSEFGTNVEWVIYDISGKAVLNGNGNIANIETIETGTYVIQVIGNDQTGTKTIIKK